MIGKNDDTCPILEGWDKEACTCLVLAFDQLNAIRARDGAPKGVGEEYFSSIVDRIDAAVKAATGKTAWLHPLLYASDVDIENATKNGKLILSAKR